MARLFMLHGAFLQLHGWSLHTSGLFPIVFYLAIISHPLSARMLLSNFFA